MGENLPKNWIETDLETIIQRMSNGSGLKQYEEPFRNSYPISRIETIWNETIDLNRVKYVDPTKVDIEKYSFLKGDVLFSHINSDKHLGKTAVFNLDSTLIHGINLLLLRVQPQFNGYLLNYLLRYYRLTGRFIEVAQRAVNQSSINQKKLNTFKIPLPPLPEQNRIVNKLDSLFTQLETIKTSMAKIPLLLKDFRQQVITQAVTGKLTEEWRKGRELDDIIDLLKIIEIKRKKKATSTLLKKLDEIYKDKSKSISYNAPVDWEEINLDRVCEKFSYGTSTKSDNEGEYVVLRMGNLQNGKIDWSGLKFTSEKSEFEKYKLEKGDVLFNRTNSPELVGKTSIYEGEKESIYAGYLIKIWNFNELNSYYLNYVLNSDFAKKWCSEVKSDGVSQSNINAQKLSKFTISFPSPKEQQEIVSRVGSLFAKADTLEQHYISLKGKIDILPQAILHKAFKGELSEQLATDGDARELLKQIQKLKKQIEKPKKK